MKLILLLVCELIFITFCSPAYGASKDLGDGFRDLGVAVPISNHRGMVATDDGHGRDVVLAYLMDHRGGYELLDIDATTGKTMEFPMPFKNGSGDSPYASILSSQNKFYTHFDSHFVEFDPAKRAFTFCSKTTPKMAMAMTEDDRGVIWLVSYPQSGVCSFDPKTRKFRDYGETYHQNWPEYARYIAADDAGWIYFGLGETASQIIALNPASGKATPLLTGNQRKKGIAYVYRDADGKVYGQPLHDASQDWYEFYKGISRKLASHPTSRPKPIITGSQVLVHTQFPDGAVLEECNLVERRMVIQDARSRKNREVSFDYTSEGAAIMGAAAAPDGTIAGGSTFPMQFFSYDPRTDKIIHRPAYGQWNTIARQADHFFIGGYPGGFLLDWTPARPWKQTQKNTPGCNPLFLTDCDPVLHRPTSLLPLDDGKTVILAGAPQYGYTGGGLLFWNRDAGTRVLLNDRQILPDQSTQSMLQLPGDKLLAGTTTTPGTGGEKKAKQAEIYQMDLTSRRIDWHSPVIARVQEYTQLFAAPRGLVYGFADANLFFVFDPAGRTVEYQHKYARTAYQQGPRIFISGPDGETFVLMANGIDRIDPVSYELKRVAKAPLPIECGGDILDGRIYFTHGSHLYSYQLN